MLKGTTKLKVYITLTVRIILALSTTHNWPIFQLDINNDFLHGFLHEEVYLKPPQGYSKVKENEVCKLKSSLYGLKQASRGWNSEFTSQLVKYGFVQSEHDHCLFIMKTSTAFIVLLVYVNDVLITGTCDDTIN